MHDPDNPFAASDTGSDIYPDGAFSTVPRQETDVPQHLPPEEEIAALRGLARRQEYELRYDDKLDILKESAFKEAIERDIAANPGAPRGLIFIDLGNFKKANGEGGSTQHIGDDVLKICASLFQRQADTIGRLGGDEFGVYVDLTNRDSNRERTQTEVLDDEIERITDIRQAIVEKYPFLGEGNVQFFVGAGGIVYDPKTSYETNRQLANIEMGTAKTKGHEAYGQYRTDGAA